MLKYSVFLILMIFTLSHFLLIEAQLNLGILKLDALGLGGSTAKPRQSGNNNGGNKKQGLDVLNLELVGIPVNLNLPIGGKDDTEERKLCNPDGYKHKQCAPKHFLKNLGLQWGEENYNDTGVFVEGDEGQSRFYHVGYQQENKPYGNCVTPKGERGKCRHVEHCVQNDFRKDYYTFLSYSCIIEDVYIGVCCPKKPRPEQFPQFTFSQNPTSTPTRPTTTRRPNQTVKPFQPPSNRRCGISEKQISRVVGGRKADPKAWPWMAAILRAGNDAASRAGQYCGGVLISEFHILSASHCLDGFEPKELKVRLGEYDFTQNSSTHKDFRVKRVKLHEEYNRYSYKNDIAILELEESAFFKNDIRPICIPGPFENLKETFVNEIGIVTGWGTIFYGGPHSDVLMEVLVPVWKAEDCQQAYTQPIEDTNLCAGVRAGGRDSCQGDSGGPLQVESRGKWQTIGIVSWGIRCAEPGYPGVYTRVNKYIRWISKAINERPF